MVAVFDMHTIANYSALRIVDSLAEGTAVYMFTAAALRLAKRQSAAARFAVWFFALLSIAVFPVTRGMWATSVLSKSNHPALVVSESWAFYLFWIWAVLAGFQMLGVGRSLLHLRRLRKSCVAVDLSTLDPLVRKTLVKGIGRKASLCTSDRVRVPTAIGLVTPAIVLPAWVLKELSATELNQVLLHELAHLRRYDDWTNLAQQLVRAVFFFHPAVWWIEKKMAFERESACDDAVLAETESPRAYAECLAHLAERSFVQRSIALAQAALGKLSETTQRVAQILDVNRPKTKGQTWRPVLSAAVGMVLVGGVLMSESPEWIAFRDTAPAQVAATTQAGRGDLPVVPAKMASSVSHAVPVTYAKFTPKRRAKHVNLQRVTALRDQQQKTQNAGLIHMASAAQPTPETTSAVRPIPVAETLFVVIEQGDSQAPEMYQIQMWRVMVLHTQADLSTKAPSKI
jgi:beta-lactamase regulating signal transducer with metallopeptidase domain